MCPSNAPDGPRCISCGRKVRSGIKCQQTFCPWQKDVNRYGQLVLSRPLKKAWGIH